MKQRLELWIATTQGIKANSLLREVDVATDQSVRPVLVNGVTAAEKIDSTVLIAAPNEDQRPAQWISGIPGEVCGDSASCRTQFTTMCCFDAMGFYVVCRDATQGGDTRAVVTLPNLALPQAIETFDGILQAWLPGRRKDRNDAQRQTQAGDAAHGVGIVMRPLEHIVVVKLGVVGEPVQSPARQQRPYGAGRSALQHEPGVGQCAIQAVACPEAE